MNQIELSEEAQRAVGQIEKLLKLAAKNPNQAEAASAAAKAQELLARYNLDMAIVEQNSGDTGKREDAKLKGGLYHYQRDLWRAVADLNFCLYWNMYVFDKNKTRIQKRKYYDWEDHKHKVERTRVTGGYTFQHRVVGRKVNTASTRVMAEYLQQAIERLTRERFSDPKDYFTRSATSYREGMAEEIIGKVYERRKYLLAAEKRKERETQRAKADGNAKGTGLTIAGLAKSEHDANIDFIYGEGTSAEWARDRAEAAAERERREAEYTKWAKENPTEAAELEEKERNKRRSYGARDYKDRKGDNRDWSMYTAGREAGKKIGIDPQAEHRSAGAIR